MSGRHEKRTECETLHVLIGVKRKIKDGQDSNKCYREVEKFDDSLKMFEARLKALGGEFRIYRTVNARDVEKARIELMTRLLKHPEKASYADSEWRTCLLQRHCAAEKKFMLDVDNVL